LKRQFLPGIEDFHQQRKSSVQGLDLPKQFLGMVFQNPMQIFAGQWSVRNDTDIPRPIADFP